MPVALIGEGDWHTRDGSVPVHLRRGRAGTLRRGVHTSCGADHIAMRAVAGQLGCPAPAPVE
jgi:hypothetical protein